MKKNFTVVIESMHLADNGTTDNALDLSKKERKAREVVMIDIHNTGFLKAPVNFSLNITFTFDYVWI